MADPSQEFGTQYYETGTPTPTEPQPGTPEAAAAAEKAVEAKAPTGGFYGAGLGSKATEKIFQGAQPTVQEDINQLLEPYMKELFSIGPEYQQEMNFLAPYLSPTHQTFNQIVDTSKAQESPTGNTAVNAAEAAQSKALENQPPPGFGDMAGAVQQYEQTIPYQAPIQNAIAYQQSLQKYQGQTVPTTTWDPNAAAAYKAAVGGQTGPGGLPSIGNAAASTNASAIPNYAIFQAGSSGAGQGT